MKKLFVIFILLMVSPLYAGETYAETGPTFLSTLKVWEGIDPEFNNGQAYLITHRFENNYEIGFIGVTSQLYTYCCGYYVVIPQNYAARFSKVFSHKKWSFVGGIAYWKHTESYIITQKQTFELAVGYKLSERTEFRFRHYSNANQTLPNIGLNMITVDLTF